MIDTHSMVLLWSAVAAVVVLVVLIAWARLNPFLTITICSLGLALAAGIPLTKTVASFEGGVGVTLGHVVIVVALGTMLGKMLTESGASERVAETLVEVFGPSHVSWAMLCAGILVGIPVFFEVGFVLLMPLAFTVANAQTLTNSGNFAFNDQAGSTSSFFSGSQTFDWGLPAFYGRNVYTAITGKNAGGTTGPYYAF